MLFSSFMLSATCMTLHQQPIPLLGHQYDSQNYNFAYEVNDAYTGDIKHQHESKQGDTVLGQYSLLQPDGVRRIVDYRADDHSGFHASVNNEGRPSYQHGSNGHHVQNGEQDGTEGGHLGQSNIWPSAATSGAPTQSYVWPSAPSSPAPSQSNSFPSAASSPTSSQSYAWPSAVSSSAPSQSYSLPSAVSSPTSSQSYTWPSAATSAGPSQSYSLPSAVSSPVPSQSFTWPSAASSAAPSQSYSLPSAVSSPVPSQSYSLPAVPSSAAPIPVAISRTSITQTFSSHGHNPWA